jgi:hypothetical protein
MALPTGNTGGDWKSWFNTDEFPTTAACDGTGTPCNMLTHGVNIGQAIKSEAVWFRRSHDYSDADSTFIRMRKLDAYHGVPSGMFQADEHLAGLMPSHGTETCAVVEAVISYAVSGAILGDASLLERAERILYNAMPASMTKSMWERVYLQQSNEIKAVVEKPHVFFTDGDDSATFRCERARERPPSCVLLSALPYSRSPPPPPPLSKVWKVIMGVALRTCTPAGLRRRSAPWACPPRAAWPSSSGCRRRRARPTPP